MKLVIPAVIAAALATSAASAAGFDVNRSTTLADVSTGQVTQVTCPLATWAPIVAAEGTVSELAVTAPGCDGHRTVALVELLDLECPQDPAPEPTVAPEATPAAEVPTCFPEPATTFQTSSGLVVDGRTSLLLPAAPSLDRIAVVSLQLVPATTTIQLGG